jgi:hypothetical protein
LFLVLVVDSFQIANKFHVGKELTDQIRQEYFDFAEKCVEDIVPEVMFTQMLVNGGENSAIAGRIGVDDPYTFENPYLFLYKKGATKPIKFPASAAFDYKGIASFVSQNTGLSFEPPGLTAELEAYISRFASTKELSGKIELMKEIKEYYAGSTDAVLGSYLKIMDKMVESDDYLKTEAARVGGLLSGAKLQPQKKLDLQTKSVILRYFQKLLA